MSDPAVTAYLTKLLCSHGGRLQRDRLADILELPEGQIEQILEDERLRFPQSSELVLACSAIKICTRYLHPEGEEDEDRCPKLHLCRHYLRGQCPPNRRPRCRFSHDIHSDHNRAVLKANELSGLNEDEIKILLFQNDNQLLPEECRNYRQDNCEKGEDCTRLHVCGYFIRGECNNRVCKRSHNLLQSNVLLNCSWLRRKTIENFHMLCMLKHMDRHQVPRGEARNEAPRGARGMSRGRGRGRPGYRRRAGSQDLLESRERRNEGSQSRWRSSSRPSSQCSMGHQSGDESFNGRSGRSRPPSQCSIGHQTGDEDYNDRRGRSRPPSQCSMGRRSGDEGCNDSDSSSDHGIYSRSKLDDLMDNWFTPSTSQSGKVRPDQFTPLEGARSKPVTKSSESARVNKPVLSQNAAQAMEPLNSRSSSEHTKALNDTLKTDYSSSDLASVRPAPIVKTYQPYVQVSSLRVPSSLTLSNDSEISIPKRPSTPNQKSEIDTYKALSSSVTKLSIAPSTPSALYCTARSSSIAQPKPATLTDSGHMTTPSSISVNTLAGADMFSRKPQTSVKPIIQTETKNAQYVLSEDFDLVFRPPQATNPKATQWPPQAINSTATQGPPATNISSVSPGKSSMEETPELCHDNLWKYCKEGGTCTKMHYCLPYRWQLFNGIDWDDFPNMEDIEKAYCDPKIDRYRLIDFQTMKSGFRPVRRLATPSSVTQPPDYVLTTKWCWYWKNENGIWTEYGKLSTEDHSDTIQSSDLESIYLSDPTGAIPFYTGHQSYYIDFKEMKQRNAYFQTEREVRRRPIFLDYQNVKMLRGSTASALDSLKQTQPDSHPITTTYTSLRDLEVQNSGYTKIPLSQNSPEFIKIVAMFSKTIWDHTVKSVWKVQNPVLLEQYNRQKDQMMRKNLSITVEEQQLFHGTYPANIDAICRESFDRSICGTNGGEYGQGAYFTRDALKAHKYSPPSTTGTRTMFLARVLVGDFIGGNPTLRHAPVRYSANGRFDSCVDDVYNPSIFVVFEKQQVYPEYILEYEEKNGPCRIH